MTKFHTPNIPVITIFNFTKKGVIMCAALVGDFQWLMASREEIERGNGCRLTCLDGKEGDLNESVSASDIVVMLTDQVPHAVRRRVLCVASVNNVPV